MLKKPSLTTVLFRNLRSRQVAKKGIKNNSPMYSIPAPFDVVFSIPLDEFHLIKEGIAKVMIRRLFEDSNTEECRAIFEAWNGSYQATTVFSETPRCSRNISTGKLKGSEMTVLIHSTFPYLIEVMSQGRAPFWYD